jgi:hypothetical protein
MLDFMGKSMKYCTIKPERSKAKQEGLSILGPWFPITETCGLTLRRA